MWKKLLIASLALSSTAFGNFYIGGGAGISSFTLKEKRTVPVDSHDLGNIGFIGGGVIGYNYTPACSRFDLGVEFFANGNTSEVRDSHDDGASRFKHEYQYNLGARILPGYRFTECAEGHVIVGYSYGSFRYKDFGAFGDVHKEFGLNGFQVGLGTTLRLSCHISLRLDATYTGYGKKHRHDIVTSSTGDRHTFRPQAVDAMAMFIYEF